MIPSKQEQGGGMAQLEGPEVNNALKQISNYNFCRKEVKKLQK